MVSLAMETPWLRPASGAAYVTEPTAVRSPAPAEELGCNGPSGLTLGVSGVGIDVPMVHITQLLGMWIPTDMAEGDVKQIPKKEYFPIPEIIVGLGIIGV